MELLLISSSNVHGYGYLDHSEAEIVRIARGRRVSFVPFAANDHDGYVAMVAERLGRMGIEVAHLRNRKDVEAAEAIFVGGGNTFRLLHQLYERDLIGAIRERVRGGVPYIGSSAGTNVATPSIMTTNDMPIVFPPTFESLGFTTFQINPHYLDPDPTSTHKGETREDRIREFHEESGIPVLGLREGSMLRIEGAAITLLGEKSARLFRRGEEPVELAPGPLPQI